MSRPTNNLALTFAEIPLKTFVKETNEPSVETKNKNKAKLEFEGNEAKLIYDEVISLKSQRKRFPRKCHLPSKTYKDEIKSPIKNTSIDNINTLFKGIESGDKNFVSQQFHTENVNISDQFGWTPLMSAAYSGHNEIVEFLLKLGANVKVKDKSGFTAIDLAVKKNHLHIINLLKQNTYKKNKKELTKDNKISNVSTQEEKTINKEEFYCDICKVSFLESSRLKHESSTLHIFNSGPKLRNTFYGISKQNKGYQILLNKGWDEEGGLGPTGEGQKYPVKTILKRDRKGLGQSKNNIARVTHFNSRDTDAVKFTNRNKKKAFKRKDRIKQLSRDAAKTKALRKALS